MNSILMLSDISNYTIIEEFVFDHIVAYRVIDEIDNFSLFNIFNICIII